MYCLDYAERPYPGNQLSFMLHDLVLLERDSQFASYWHSYKILHPYVAATVPMHFSAIFFSIGASKMKTH